jgi:outer membrane lipoprotein-sorting protein
MPEIQQLDLTVSLDSKGVITVQVDYTLTFSADETDANIAFNERVVLMRRLGGRDLYQLHAQVAGPPVASQEPGDIADETISVLVDGTTTVAALGAPPVARTFRHVLNAEETAELLEVGREHPYVVVSAVPARIRADMQIAELEIDVGDPAAGRADFRVGDDPFAVVFDGENIWVANRGSNNLTRLALDGTLLGNPIPAANPVALASDGAGSIWAAFAGDGSVMKFASSGVLAGHAGGGGPVALAFAGGFLWGALGDGSLTKVAADFGQPDTFPTGVASPSALTTDGESVWVVDEENETVTRFRAADGTEVASGKTGADPVAIAFDAETNSLWVANLAGNSVSKLNAGDCTPVDVYQVGPAPAAVAVGTDKVWVSNSGADTITTLRGHDGAVQGTIVVGNNPGGIAYDGESLWVVSQADGTVAKRPG